MLSAACSAPLQTTASLTVEADRTQTSAGGTAVTLTASGAGIDASAIQWSLAPDSLGSLSQPSGNRVEYIPPPAGTGIVNSVVYIIAITGNVTSTIVIILSGSQNVSVGTQGASTITPPAPPAGDNTVSAPGIYLLSGNEFGAGVANGAGTAARFDTPSG